MSILTPFISFLLSVSLLMAPVMSAQAQSFSNFGPFGAYAVATATATTSVSTTTAFGSGVSGDINITNLLGIGTTSATLTPVSTSTSFGGGVSGGNSSFGGGISGGVSIASILGIGALAGGLALGGAWLAGLLTSTGSTLAISTASNAKGLSFGGRIVTILPCFTYGVPAEQITITPAPATKNVSYIWTPTTLRGVPPPGAPPLYPPSPNPDPPPYAPGQQILGIADIPYFCCVPPSVSTAPFSCQIPAHPFWIPVPPLLGQRMQWANQSLVPSTPGMTEVLSGSGTLY